MLILASNSPRRRELLSLGGWDFSISAPNVDETVLPGELPAEYAHRLAERKAKAVLEGREKIPTVDAIILAADTAVVDQRDYEGCSPSEILGKPVDSDDAEQMLRQLRGRAHYVYTGLALLSVGDGKIIRDLVITEVHMRDYSDEEMRAYIESGDPFDKAGGYAIQHPIFQPVQNLQGCYANVMGLPVCHVARLLNEFGVHPQKDIIKGCLEMLKYPCRIALQTFHV